MIIAQINTMSADLVKERVRVLTKPGVNPDGEKMGTSWRFTIFCWSIAVSCTEFASAVFSTFTSVLCPVLYFSLRMSIYCVLMKSIGTQSDQSVPSIHTG